MFDLTGQVALVTGSSRGIGLAAAHALGRQGATVVLNGRDEQKLAEAAQSLQAQGIKTHIAAFDILDIDQSLAAVDAVSKSLGKIDILFANAAIQHREPLLSYPRQEFERIISGNLTAQWALGQHIAAGMAKQGYGRIIFTGSITAIRGKSQITAYTAAKAALHGLVRQWAAELSDSGITVNAIAPGYVATELTRNLWGDEAFNSWLQERVPQKKWGEPDDIASAVVFMAARESRFVTGQVLAVDGGLSACMM